MTSSHAGLASPLLLAVAAEESPKAAGAVASLEAPLITHVAPPPASPDPSDTLVALPAVDVDTRAHANGGGKREPRGSLQAQEALGAQQEHLDGCSSMRPTRSPSLPRGLLGVLLFSLTNGAQLTPMVVWQQGRPKGSTSLPFLFSQMLGVWLMATAVLLCYAMKRKLFHPGRPVLRMNRRWVLPAILTGAMWAIGAMCQYVAVSLGGYVPQYPIMNVTAVAVSTLVSVLYFKEAPGRY